jgi:hypothetical protein
MFAVNHQTNQPITSQHIIKKLEGVKPSIPSKVCNAATFSCVVLKN